MNPVARIGLLVFAAVVLLVAGLGFYVVDETQQVVITEFGKPVGDAIANPGLKWKLPYRKANYFDRRFLEWDGDRNQVPTKDKRFIHVDAYARWQITDPLKYFQRLRTEAGAQSRLDDILDGETRNVIANHNLIEVVRSTNREFTPAVEGEAEALVEAIEFGRAKLAEEVLANAQTRTTDLGIEILDFRFKRLNYVTEVQQEVFTRMISERKRIAERFRSEGQGEAARISGLKERELKRITSEAFRKAEEVRGKADAEAADIYADAYNRDPEFYRFLRTMEVLGKTLDNETTLVLSTDGEFLRYLDRSR